MLDPTHSRGFARISHAAHWLCLCLLALSACKLNEKATVAGGLVVGVDTDLAMPKDLDSLRIEVTQGTAMLFMHEQDLAQGMSTLPLEFEVKDAQENIPVLVRAIGSKAGSPRIERSAITTVPTSYLGFVRLQLNYLCDGMVAADGTSSCGATMTCVQGSCENAAIATSLPDYYQRDAANSGDGTGMMSSATSGCFEVSKCLTNLTEVQPLTANDCSFESAKLFPTDLNVALQLELGSEGVCNKSQCLIVLDSDGGFRVGNDDRVFLPMRVCELRDQGANIRVAMSMQCASKTQSTPLCRDGGKGSSGVDPGKITVGTTDPVGGACAGGGARACDLCGSQSRTCQSGLWSEFGMCGDQGVCEPNMVESCGVNGIRTCGGDCTWGNCENQTCDGAATRACGNCGTQHRSCNNGAWTEWSACSEEGVCMPGTTQACGSGGTQACEGSCQWSACTMQVCVGAATDACGNCGTRTRTCDSNTAQWSEWGPCENEGECRPDSVMACGRDGEQTCGGNCQWDTACTGQTCEGPARQACGLCGTQIRTCDMNTGQYSDWSACFAEGECEPDAITSCGSGGERACGGNCRWGLACTGQTCEGPSTQACGNCGTQSRRCDTNTGLYSDWGACLNQGDCSPGETRTCGAQGTQTCNNTCNWGSACPGQMCTGPDTQTCPNNPCSSQTRTCDTNTGKWSAWTACAPGCEPGTVKSCAGGQQQTCNAQTCDWSACACPAGTRTCNGGTTCIDTSSNTTHCGGCNMPCLAGQDCNAGKCQCPPGTMLCGNQCVNTATSEDNCGTCGRACLGGAMCQGGKCACPSNNGVPRTYCEDSDSCVNTANDKNNCGECEKVCPGSHVCVGGECGCAPGTTDCGDVIGCVNTQTSEDHCGRCGKPCAEGQLCIDGACTTQCPAGQTACGNKCADLLTDAQHCGSCDIACMNGMTCQNKQCACPPGTAQCGGPGTACVPLNTPTHCGSCTIACEAGGTCNAALKCTCPAASTMCGDECVNTQTNPDNCGRCDNPCPTGTACSGGMCRCPAGQKLCGTRCIDVTGNDANNCGDCDKLCDGTCTNGSCGCAAGEHMCTTGCAPRSPTSCTSSCTACPPRENATVACSAQDQCVYTCTPNHATCGSACCDTGQVCMGGVCQAMTTTPPTTPPTPQGGSKAPQGGGGAPQGGASAPQRMPSTPTGGAGPSNAGGRGGGNQPPPGGGNQPASAGTPAL